MRDNIKNFAAIVSTYLPLPEPIFEFGSFQVPGQEGYADLRYLFQGCEFVGADLRYGPGVDRILDLHNIDVASESVGTVLCLDTLEHVEYPNKALREIYRILLPTTGVVVISSVMDFPIHNHPYDYWRFTPAAFKSLLKPFKQSFVGFAGKAHFPHTVVGLGFKGSAPDLSEFEEKYQQWQNQQKLNFREVFRLLTPPILHSLLAWTYGLARKKWTRKKGDTNNRKSK